MLSFAKIFLSALTLATLFGVSVAAPLDVIHHSVNQTRTLQKRFSGHATYYQTGLGACGQYHNPGDFIVALNTAQYGYGSPGPQCFKTLVISYGGKQIRATVVDECPTCGYGDLDFSQALFESFASTDVGTFSMTWEWADGKAPEPTTSPTPTSISTKQEPTTSSTPTTTSTSTSASTSSSSLTSSSSSSSVSGQTASSESSISGSTTSTGIAGEPTLSTGAKGLDGTTKMASGSNLDSISLLLTQLGQIVLSGASQK